MKKIYSKIDPDTLLHIINRYSEITDRTDVCPEKEFIQLATLKMNKGKTFRPHKHIFKSCPSTSIAQESWVVIQGSVKVFLYDLNDEIICEEIIGKGDCSITLYGGHNYEILEDNTVVYEYKTGPYQGQSKDKEFIGGTCDLG